MSFSQKEKDYRYLLPEDQKRGRGEAEEMCEGRPEGGRVGTMIQTHFETSELLFLSQHFKSERVRTHLMHRFAK